MQKGVVPKRKPVWRKIGIVAALPLLTFIWATGWILTQIEPQGTSVEHVQTTCVVCPEPKKCEQEMVA